MSQQPSIFCRQCDYALDLEQADHRCPECGESFDPVDPSTFLTSRRRLVNRGPRSPIVWGLLFAPLAGAVDVIAVPDAFGGLVPAILIAVAALAWCVDDARKRDYPLSSGSQFAILILAVIMVPAYMFMTRGIRGTVPGLVALALFAAAIGLSALGMFVAWELGLA